LTDSTSTSWHALDRKTARLQDIAAPTSVPQGSDAGGAPVSALRSCAPELPERKVTTREWRTSSQLKAQTSLSPEVGSL
jgi:hypothetical protein